MKILAPPFSQTTEAEFWVSKQPREGICEERKIVLSIYNIIILFAEHVQSAYAKVAFKVGPTFFFSFSLYDLINLSISSPFVRSAHRNHKN